MSTALTRSTAATVGDEDDGTLTMTIAGSGISGDKGALVRNIKRTSGLQAPIVSLGGAHSGEITSCKFNPSGSKIAASSADRSISLWKTYPPHSNYAHLPALHKQAILDLAWSLEFQDEGEEVIWSVGAEGTLIGTELTGGTRIIRYHAHSAPINSLSLTLSPSGRDLLLTGSDDGLARVWDPSLFFDFQNDGQSGGGVGRGSKECVAEFDDGEEGVVTAVQWSGDGNQCFVGGIDNCIKVWDLRTSTILYTLRGHTDTVASLSLSPNGHYLASYGFDSVLMVWDVRPFCVDPTRVWRGLVGAPNGFEQILTKCAFSKTDNGARVAVGGGDRTVTIFEVESGKILYKLGGHKGSVGAVDFHPREPIILTGSKDTQMLLGEIDATDLS